jgi:Ca2+-binding EF-hand superfamily protein
LFSKKPLVIDNKDNLENKVDLVRVKDARRALRRKYADRNTIDKIFDKYDNGSKGYIDVVDILNQARSIGLGISLEEAQVLI